VGGRRQFARLQRLAAELSSTAYEVEPALEPGPARPADRRREPPVVEEPKGPGPPLDLLYVAAVRLLSSRKDQGARAVAVRASRPAGLTRDLMRKSEGWSGAVRIRNYAAL
jgi:hypothetical protein